MAKLICPYCHSTQLVEPGQNTLICQCGQEVPPNFVKVARKHPPIYLATVGNTTHGKTTYIDSLAVTIENLGKISQGTFHDYLDNYTFEEIRRIRCQVQEREERKSTHKSEQPEPLLISIRNFLENPFNTLAVYDLAGEVFDDREAIDEYSQPLKHVNTIWFFISLFDLQHNDEQGRTLSDLFNIYRTGMERIQVDTKDRKLLVIYTKADKLANDLPGSVRDYLRIDPYQTLDIMKRSEAEQHQLDEYEYVQQLYRISSELEEFTYDEVDGGISFINMVKASGMKLSFCAVSSIGRESSGGANQMLDYRRYRVIDPLLLALNHTNSSHKKKSSQGKFILVIDTGEANQVIYESGIPQAAFDILTSNDSVTTYYVGTSISHGPPDTKPPEQNPPSKMLPVIGPILETVPQNSYVLIITNRKIIDLNDFDFTEWQNRLGIICFKKDDILWPKVEAINESTYELTRIVEKFFDLNLE
ncbi:MAG: hypothetical protein AAF702_21480 [Chloroflexota bacterium]